MRNKLIKLLGGITQEEFHKTVKDITRKGESITEINQNRIKGLINQLSKEQELVRSYKKREKAQYTERMTETKRFKVKEKKLLKTIQRLSDELKHKHKSHKKTVHEIKRERRKSCEKLQEQINLHVVYQQALEDLLDRLRYGFSLSYLESLKPNREIKYHKLK